MGSPLTKIIVSEYDIASGDYYSDVIDLQKYSTISIGIKATDIVGGSDSEVVVMGCNNDDTDNFIDLEYPDGSEAILVLDAGTSNNMIIMNEKPCRFVRLKYVVNSVTGGKLSLDLHATQ
jgi:hypothetical protein